MFRAANVEVEVEFEKLVVLVKIAVLFPYMTLTMARRTIPAVMDALALVTPAPGGLSTLDPRFGAAVDVGSVCNVLPAGVDVARINGVELRVVGPTGCRVDGRVNCLLADELEAAILELKIGVDKSTADDDDGVRSAEDERSPPPTDEPIPAPPLEEGQLMLVAVIVDVTVVVVVV